MNIDFRTETFANNFIKNFRVCLSEPSLTLVELHNILNFCGIKPIRTIKNNVGKECKVFSKFDINSLLMNTERLLLTKNFLDEYRKRTESQSNNADLSYKKLFPKGKNYYTNDDLGRESDNLLRQQEVWFSDDTEDLLYETVIRKHFYFTDKQMNLF